MTTANTPSTVRIGMKIAITCGSIANGYIAEIRRGIEHLLAGLDERYRVALELRYMAEKSYTEIADIMDLPVGTVKTYIHRGKLSLKRMLHDVHENEPREEYGTL